VKVPDMSRQLLRSGTSVGTQYREATRAKSNADCISKIAGPLQELEETEYWLELLGESGFFPEDGLAAVRKETGELKGIFVSIVNKHQSKVQTFEIILNSSIPFFPLSFCLHPLTDPLSFIL
jgi:four helix bundle protein